MDYYKAVRATATPGVYESRNGNGDTLWQMGVTRIARSVHGFSACANPAALFLTKNNYSFVEGTDLVMLVRLIDIFWCDGVRTIGVACTPVRIVPLEEWRRKVAGHTLLATPAGDVYRLVDGVPHNESDDTEPAVRLANGTQLYYKHGRLHRDDDKPAIIRNLSTKKWSIKKWYRDGVLHRDGCLPAFIGATGKGVVMSKWYCHGKRVEMAL